MHETATVDATEQRQTRRRNDSVIGLSSDDWKVCRWLALRATGFPTHGALSLASDRLSEHVDGLLEREQRAAKARARLLEVIDHQIAAQPDSQKRITLENIRQRVEDGAMARAMGDADFDSSLEAYAKARDDHRAFADGLQEVFDEETQEIYAHLREVAADPRFREAITWQNYSLIPKCLDSVLRHPNRNNSQARQHLETIARYLLRYSTKNDTIGFFGPVGWAQVSDEVEGIELAPGEQFLAQRAVFFETWGIDVLAKQLSEDARFKPWIKPRKHPFIHVDGKFAHPAMGAPQELSEQQRQLIEACDGRQNARQIAHALCAEADSGFDSEAQVYELLDDLAAYVNWTVEVPVSMHPEQALRDAIEQVGDQALRRELLEPLERLETAKKAIADAAGDPDALADAFEQLNEAFFEITEQNATRRSGQLYAGRTLVVEECARDLKLTIGTDVLDRLIEPLSLLLKSARWQSYEIGRRFQAHCEAIYANLAGEDGGEVDVIKIFFNTMMARKAIQREVVDELQARWEEILGLAASDERVVEFSSAELRAQVDQHFDAPHAGWTYARFQSPDLLVAADSAEAIGRGDCEFVVGEIHPSRATLQHHLFFTPHPNVAELYEQFAAALDAPQVFPAFAKRGPVSLDSGRRSFTPGDQDYLLQFEAFDSDHPSEKVLPISDMVVVESSDGLCVRSRDGRLEFEFLEFWGAILGFIIVPTFEPIGAREHRPRVLVDNLVIQREQWHFAPTDLGFVHQTDRAQRLVDTKRWAEQHRFPRACFVKVPPEEKPEYMDWDSPVCCDMFARAVRRAQREDDDSIRITVAEMYPDLEQTWAVDDSNQRYTGELRMVLVDSATPGETAAD